MGHLRTNRAILHFCVLMSALFIGNAVQANAGTYSYRIPYVDTAHVGYNETWNKVQIYAIEDSTEVIIGVQVLNLDVGDAYFVPHPQGGFTISA